MSSNGYREMISSYLWLSFHYTSYKPKSGIVFQVHWDHSWLETTFFFFLLVSRITICCMRWAGKVAPARFTFVWNVYSFTRPRLSHFFPVVCRDCVLNRTAASDSQQASIFPQRKFARGTGRDCKTKTNWGRKFPASFRFILLCSALDLCPFFSLFADLQVVDLYVFLPRAEKQNWQVIYLNFC